MIREIVESDVPALFVVRPQTRENAMTVEELARIGITPDSIRDAIEGSHRGWLFEENGEVGGFAMVTEYFREHDRFPDGAMVVKELLKAERRSCALSPYDGRDRISWAGRKDTGTHRGCCRSC